MSVLVGTAGWADKDLIASGWYPRGVRTPAARLRHYADQFPLVEVDSSYYAIPRRSTTEVWARESPDGFVMDVKAYGLLTSHRVRAASLPPELRGPGLGGATWIAAGSAPESLVTDAWQYFHDAVTPLHHAARLGLVLLQFPPSCRPGPAGMHQIERALELCSPLQAAVEFRHGSWFDEPHLERALDLLRSHRAAFVSTDMPQTHEGAVPLLFAVTSDKAVIRLHGRSGAWAEGGKEARYRYEYTPAELAQWARWARELSKNVREVHVVLNTCCAGAAQRAATHLRHLINTQTPPPAVPN
jgi:uncharacterized protein YecE (DUF72 family)